MRQRIIPSGLVNRGGAPLPLQWSFNGLRNSVMRTGRLAHCGNEMPSRREGVGVSDVLYLGTERKGITFPVSTARRRISASA